MSGNKSNPELARWDRFLGLFRDRVTMRDETRPAARYWKSSQLRSLIQEIRRQFRAELLTNFPTGTVVLTRMEKIGWIKPVPIVWSKPSAQVIYRVSLDQPGDVTIDPLELLQGYDPKGIICNLGALQYYALTTQIPEFYHIAKIRSGEISRPIYNHLPAKPPKAAIKSYNPMGTEIFTMGKAKFYETIRYPMLMPGVQVRLVSAISSLRITDLEQTLLDTLMHPAQCGGSSVVFESWERASEQIDFLRMSSHLEAINNDLLWRRAATMISLMEIPSSDPALAILNEKARSAVANQSEFEPISLLPDHQYTDINAGWRVFVP